MPPSCERRGRRASWSVVREDRGTALVEFALVLPVLLLLLLGMIEFGRAINYWIDASHLANVAARWAAVDKNPGPGDTLQDSIREQADTDELKNGTGSVSPPGLDVCIDLPDGSDVGDPVEATVSADYNWMPFLELDAATTTLKGTATMRLEQAPSGEAYVPDGDCS